MAFDAFCQQTSQIISKYNVVSSQLIINLSSNSSTMSEFIINLSSNPYSHPCEVTSVVYFWGILVLAHSVRSWQATNLHNQPFKALKVGQLGWIIKILWLLPKLPICIIWEWHSTALACLVPIDHVISTDRWLYYVWFN